MKNCSTKDVVCVDCGKQVSRASNRQKRCSTCKQNHDNRTCSEHYRRNYVKKGYDQSGENNNNWKGGIGTYRKILEDIKQCQKCSSAKFVVTHHIDGNRYNNSIDNLIRLCKRCHQIEHNCIDNLGEYARKV